ncbi:MAG TPA: hypothetical protein VMM76_15495 [Pirellulaceae bacterium]|nr:hypothetical protein [Pirellulaceae bacterium]
MLDPQDLPGRYGRVVSSIDHLLGTLECPAVLAGGLAVWRHGYYGRMTQDLDVVLPADRIEEFLIASSMCGFQVLTPPKGRWPKLVHKETGIQVVILPEGERPGTAKRLAPTTIPHPLSIGASGATLRYVPLLPLIELKLAAGRGRDEADVIELLRVNEDQTESIRRYLESIHVDYLQKFEQLMERAHEENG